jgi:hypothetical protein
MIGCPQHFFPAENDISIFFCWESDESRGRLRLTRAITILQAPVGHPQRLARVFGGMHFFHRETWSARRADISSVATVDLRMSAALAAAPTTKQRS